MNHIEKAVEKRLKHILAPIGFCKKDKNSSAFSRDIPVGFERITVNIRFFIGIYRGMVLYAKRFDDVENHLWKYKTELKINRIYNDGVTILSGLDYFNSQIKDIMSDVFDIPIDDTLEGINEFCDLLEYNVVEKILPLADKFNDIKYLEQQIRTSLNGYTEFSEDTLEKDLLKYINTQHFRYRIPAIAKLAGVEDYGFVREIMINEMKRLVAIDTNYQIYLDVMYRLLDDLNKT